MNYAVIRSGGKQHKVSVGDIIEVDKLTTAANGQVSFSEILLYVADGKVRIGTPTIKEVTVKGTVLEQKKGKKIRVAKFKAKSRYRRVMGFRPQLTRIKIESILIL